MGYFTHSQLDFTQQVWQTGGMKEKKKKECSKRNIGSNVGMDDYQFFAAGDGLKLEIQMLLEIVREAPPFLPLSPTD